MAEKEYIAKDALIEEMGDCKYANPENNFQRGVNASVDILNACIKCVPAADVVEVVRCKDCKWGIVSTKNPFIKWCNKHETHFRNDDFCSHGERKERG